MPRARKISSIPGHVLVERLRNLTSGPHTSSAWGSEAKASQGLSGTALNEQGRAPAFGELRRAARFLPPRGPEPLRRMKWFQVATVAVLLTTVPGG